MLEFTKKNRENRFHIQEVGCNNSISTYVLTDMQTGVQYLYVWGGASGGITPLLGTDLNISVVDVSKGTNK